MSPWWLGGDFVVLGRVPVVVVVVVGVVTVAVVAAAVFLILSADGAAVVSS